MGYHPEVLKRLAQAKDDLETNNRWQAWAACRDYPLGFFDIKSTESENVDTLPHAVEVCDTLCPVRAECWSSADRSDKRNTVRGGRYPSAWAGRGRPTPRPPRAKLGECIEGHDLSLPGARNPNRHCSICEPPKPPGGLHRIGTVCKHGHTFTKETLTTDGKCATCQAQRKAEYRARMKA